MATSSNLSSIIRYYSEKQNTPFIDLREFCAWIKKYAEKKVEEQAELVKYLGDPTNTVIAELSGLEEKHLASVVTNGNKKTIICVSFLASRIEAQYKSISQDESKPYPGETDLPKHFPPAILEKKKAEQYITECIENQNSKTPHLYILEFSRELPNILLAASTPILDLIAVAQRKIMKMVRKEEYHDYLMKKLRSTNPTKEISIKHFFTTYVDPENNEYHDFSDGDDYYLWNQLCYYLRLDYEKIQDRTIEDTNILQSIEICEIYNTYLKHKFQINQKREDALKELKNNLLKSPYFYSTNQILKFHDNNGRLLYGQYSEEDLKNFLQKESTEANENELPALVVFRVASGTRYYVYKEKVIPLVVRLCNEAHGTIEELLIDKWHNSLLEHIKLPEMTEDARYEKQLEIMVEEKSPVLYALLNANFMTLLAYEKNTENLMDSFQLFADDKLLPYSKLLMLRKESVLSEAKARLPFIYSLPFLSWIIALFKGKKNKKDKTETVTVVKNPFEEENEAPKQQLNRVQALAEQAIALSAEFIPEGSTIDRELNYLSKQWNKMISKEAYVNLTEDVNSLIRDYTRRVCRTLSATSFTKERVENLAETLVKTPNMQKIGEEKALTEYVALYMIRLVSNSR